MIQIRNGLNVPLPSLHLTLASEAAPVIAVGVYYKNDLEEYPFYELHVNGKFYAHFSGYMVYYGKKPDLVSFQVYLPRNEASNKGLIGKEFGATLFALDLSVDDASAQKSGACNYKLV